LIDIGIQKMRSQLSKRRPPLRPSSCKQCIFQQELSVKTFLAVYTGSAAGRAEWEKLDERKRKEREGAGMKAWGDWMATHAAAIVVTGGPLGKTKLANAKGISDTKNNLVGYVVVQAQTHDAAARMFTNHPHFTIFPGDSVEIMECLPIPGQG
jgi:hypothetical protein